MFGNKKKKKMANEEVTIQFEGYDDDTATYVVLTNTPVIEEIEEITEHDRYIETEEIEFQPDCDENIDQLLVNGTQTSNIETISADADVQLVAVPSGKYPTFTIFHKHTRWKANSQNGNLMNLNRKSNKRTDQSKTEIQRHRS